MYNNSEQEYNTLCFRMAKTYIQHLKHNIIVKCIFSGKNIVVVKESTVQKL